ncbi:MAG: PilZ domain-containing protein [Acidobacteria bacterium]|nr:PilZ domain-containing protein [Acidobacteriota bacterium]
MTTVTAGKRRTGMRTSGHGVFVECLAPHRLQFFPENLGRGGMLFHLTEDPPKLGAHLALKIYLPTHLAPIKADGKVIRTQPDGQLHKVAVQFNEFSKTDQIRILHFCLLRVMTYEDYTLLFKVPLSLPNPESAEWGSWQTKIRGVVTALHASVGQWLSREKDDDKRAGLHSLQGRLDEALRALDLLGP